VVVGMPAEHGSSASLPDDTEYDPAALSAATTTAARRLERQPVPADEHVPTTDDEHVPATLQSVPADEHVPTTDDEHVPATLQSVPAAANTAGRNAVPDGCDDDMRPIDF